jgi:integrase/recombinase XerD
MSMAVIKLAYVTADRDANGNVRYYFRRPEQRKIRLRGVPGSTEFMTAYGSALAGNTAPNEERKAAAPGSFRAVCQAYYASPEFKALDHSTKSWRRRALDGIAERHGDKPIDRVEPGHVYRLRDAKAATPAAANTLLKALKAIFKWALKREFVKQNPAREVEPIHYQSKGFHSWTLEEVERYESRHPADTKARLALALLLYTACRREDATRLGQQHISNGRLKYIQAKNEHRSPIEMDIPVHPDLADVVAKTKLTGRETFLVTNYGKPFSPAGFGIRFRQWCDQAGLPHCSAHGLRKATAARLAERGASPHEIMSITGHRTLQEVERYTRGARQKELADRAMAKLLGGRTGTSTVPNSESE